jgi:DnaJ-like protein
MNDHSHHYAILGVSPDTEWKALRARYKRLIGQWHPDRYPTDASAREMAEEHSKQITIAYQALERYYRDHGVLPPTEPATIGADSGATVRPADAAPVRARGAADTGAGDATGYEPVQRPTGRRRGVLILLSALIVAAYGAYRYGEEASEAGAAAEAARLEEAADPEPRTENPRESGGISAGSTLGDVYAVQGIPTSTQGDTWHYGKSSIRFAQGKVVSWTQHPDNPLRIARDQPIELREGLFDVGSTKDEVRSIQGTPVTESESVWDYGPSRVYFEHNRVVRWEASPLQPLRVPR